MSDTGVQLGTTDVLIERRPNGEILLRHPDALKSYPVRFTERLEKWASEAPDRVFRSTTRWSRWLACMSVFPRLPCRSAMRR